MKKQPSGRSSNVLLPVVLILAGVVLGLAVLIWQLARPLQTGQNLPQPANSSVYPEIERISLADAKQAFDQKQAVFLDVRAAESYQAGHIPGALNIPESELQSRINELNPGDWIITYCT